jgi:hypothetical protein
MIRRNFLKSVVLAGGALYTQHIGALNEFDRKNKVRTFHLSVNSGTLDDNPDLFEIIIQSGITDVWLTGYINGYWYHPVERTKYWRERFLKKGIAAHIIHVPLGHPANLSASIGSNSLGIEGEIPNITPKHWKKKTTIDGSLYSGVSIHPPITEENIEALKRSKSFGFKKVFLDDDFRLGIYPGVIGGCFCPEHKQEFLEKYGYNENAWHDLIHDIKQRDFTETLYSWVNYTCDRLSSAFKTMQSSVSDIQLGIMVMYLGAEKSGIRLTDYNGSLMRVGELMFDDNSFGKVKGKTDELFSSLFHRRYVSPEFAFSETTAYPPENLSAKNLAAKLNVSLLSDVRNTMFMSGLTPFPPEYWSTLAPAINKSARLHEKVARQKPRGPFKHYWGEASRYVGNDNPNSLFLAAGVPFEVTDTLNVNGWTFLAEYDAKAIITGKLKAGKSKLIHNLPEFKNNEELTYLPKTVEDIFEFKQKILPELANVPYVVEDLPVVCSWYPDINSVLLWNLSESPKKLTVKFKNQSYNINVDGLDSELLQL